ncbi:hypothetical protein [Agrobacterium larrymoorei]|uniref:hypothetical protein n=1 Tax=Agrobacterium larrymoorei TaxID=160699 RepID=UPI0030C5D1CB
MTSMYLKILVGLAVVCLAAFIFAPAFAQDAQPVIAPSSWLYDVWTIVQPIVVLLVSTVGPVLVGWISARLIALLKVSDEKQRVEIEAKMREALHQSALNAIRFAFTKEGMPSVAGRMTDTVLNEAVAYVTDKNPEALAKLGVDQKALKEILLSKIPEVMQSTK